MTRPSSNRPQATKAAHSSTRPSMSPLDRHEIIEPQQPRSGASISRPGRQKINHPKPWKNAAKLTVYLSNVPKDWGTYQVHQVLQRINVHPKRIEVSRVHAVQQRESLRPGTAIITFRPPPENSAWISNGISIAASDGKVLHIGCQSRWNTEERSFYDHEHHRRYPDEMRIVGSGIQFGVLQDEKTMLVMRDVERVPNNQIRMVANLQRKCLEVRFDLGFQAPILGERRGNHFVFRFPFTQLTEIIESRDDSGNICFIIPVSSPPLVYRKTSDIKSTHDPKLSMWDERQMWYRQVSIDLDPHNDRSKKTQLQNDDALIDVGRWLTYSLVCDPVTSVEALMDFKRAMIDHNIKVHPGSICLLNNQRPSLWSWLENAHSTGPGVASSALAEINATAVHLPFSLRYQLEVCISRGLLHECNLDAAFANALVAMDTTKAVRLLEKVAETKDRFFNPMEIFRLKGQVSLMRKKMPRHCTMVRSATITPTTIYFNSPSMETSNRVIRKLQHYEDRFLRVKFRDESYKGTIMSFDDNTTNELFTRIKRTMKNGVVVGGRHYEFLAFGNSQFREHGAYFFASTPDMTADMIRASMGDFSSIKVVAKYASRLGQCFSTTRAMPNTVTIKRIPDIERNGHCFTDGVGKISLLLAQLTSAEMKLATTSNSDCPSVYQFRLGGCKGVLTVDSTLRGAVIEIRPSQEKFPADYRGLEICRISQNAAAYLNHQIVLVLAALGVSDDVFLSKLRMMLARMEEAMEKPEVAIEELQKGIDLNQTTVTIATMIMDGFMATKDPFVVSCLRLWRSWNIKYLKEKARILVSDGAFVLGCVDETGTLRGHTSSTPASDKESHDESKLPEIFLQYELPEKKGQYQILEGVCTIARNPSLHPGDIRVVRAVNVPQLNHLRDCLVLPQTGDRDLASMCSGGDLDGDDYLVMWDKDLLPKEWNHAPMDYTAPAPLVSNGPVTVDAITSFFVTHMKEDNLGRIATAHRYWADRLEEGVKSDQCLELAELHSKAVDFAKTGVPAQMPKELKINRWPHWAEKKDNRVYRSNRVLGKLYDEVQRVPFVPAWELPFDDRILKAFELDEQMLKTAREVKQQYDEAIRRLMAQHGIESEFEIWTAFVLSHNHESRDFKIAEELGEAVAGVKQQFQDLCHKKAGTTPLERSWEKIAPFVAAMYTVTANEIAAANAECAQRKLVAGMEVPVRLQTADQMPFLSFPWLFQRELGRIAMRGDGAQPTQSLFPNLVIQPKQLKKPQVLDAEKLLPPLEEIVLESYANKSAVMDAEQREETAAELEEHTLDQIEDLMDLEPEKRAKIASHSVMNAASAAVPSSEPLQDHSRPTQTSKQAGALANHDDQAADTRKDFGVDGQSSSDVPGHFSSHHTPVLVGAANGPTTPDAGSPQAIDTPQRNELTVSTKPPVEEESDDEDCGEIVTLELEECAAIKALDKLADEWF